MSMSLNGNIMEYNLLRGVEKWFTNRLFFVITVKKPYKFWYGAPISMGNNTYINLELELHFQVKQCPSSGAFSIIFPVIGGSSQLVAG